MKALDDEEFQATFGCEDIVDGRNPANHLGCLKPHK